MQRSGPPCVPIRARPARGTKWSLETQHSQCTLVRLFYQTFRENNVRCARDTVYVMSLNVQSLIRNRNRTHATISDLFANSDVRHPARAGRGGKATTQHPRLGVAQAQRTTCRAS